MRNFESVAPSCATARLRARAKLIPPAIHADSLCLRQGVARALTVAGYSLFQTVHPGRSGTRKVASALDRAWRHGWLCDISATDGDLLDEKCCFFHVFSCGYFRRCKYLMEKVRQLHHKFVLKSPSFTERSVNLWNLRRAGFGLALGCLVLTSSVLILVSGAAWAAPAKFGLKSTFAEVTIRRELALGGAYSVARHARKTLQLLNSGTETLELSVAAAAPQPSELKAGYEPIPDAGWVRFDVDRLTLDHRLTLEPGAQAAIDVVLAIPDDPKWAGRRFAAVLEARSINKANVGVGLRGRLLFAVAGRAKEYRNKGGKSR